MRPVASSCFGNLLLVIGLSAVALTLCILYVHTQGPAPGSTEEPQAQILRARDLFEPRLLAQDGPPDSVATKEIWGPNAQCDKLHAMQRKPVSAGLKWIECKLSNAIFAVVANPPAFYLAILVDAIWHSIRFAFERKYHNVLNPRVRELCLGVIVLNIFYDKDLRLEGYQFTCSCAVLCIESIILRAVEWKNFRLAIATNEDLEKMKVSNRYQHPAVGFVTLFLLFLCQLTLGLFYIYALLNTENDFGDSSGWRWFIGFILCIVTDADQVGNAFDFKYWLTFFYTNDPRIEGIRSTKSRICYILPKVEFKSDMRCRMIMSVVVNIFIRRIIFGTAPVLVSEVEKPMDFITNCLAVFFITKLDDLDNPVDFVTALKARDDYLRALYKEDKINVCCLSIFGSTSAATEEDVFVNEDVFNDLANTMKKRIEALEDVLKREGEKANWDIKEIKKNDATPEQQNEAAQRDSSPLIP